MKTIKTILTGTAMMLAAALSAPAAAQESSYTYGTVWSVSRIDVMPGQFENYMDWLAKNWKRIQEAGKAEGAVVSYRVLATNHRRDGEPDLLLVIEYKDYFTTAQQAAFEKKVNAIMAQDNRKADTASGERAKMRENIGSTEYQELILK